MSHAIFETGGKQYRVKEGDEVYIEKLDLDDNIKVKFDKVLAVTGDDDPIVGTPYIKGATVTGKVIKSGKAKKIIVYKMRRRKGYRRKQGHRQPYTKIQIDKISVKSTVTKGESKSEAESATEKQASVKAETAAKKTTAAKKAATAKTETAAKKPAAAKTEQATAKKETKKSTTSKTEKSEG